MMRIMLKSKIHRAFITDTKLHYEGSIACDPCLLKAADILPNEKVLVVNLNNGERFETYAIPGTDGEIGLRGAAARLGHAGDCVIIMAFGLMDSAECASWVPRTVHVDRANRLIPEK
ncbi:MAG TPA: aspartate 1-decarboxylase [Kiritimatiellia bacterium]|nr:aspartate 1-decarboxylase [Kiritimatiellia bacterium]HNS81984.1 aspartate 1-decarboxylase [Kiritimatiellia bacterium]HPA78583.1 aspartate 1-decarboxylase [Kiritimatiellia bacterium]HQQ04648.1 aspartate 1-decarboxylase [Kiritimatiellia bacterium]